MKDDIDVLVVDDDKEFLRQFTELLKTHFGALVGRLDVAHSVAEARDLFANYIYELVIADIDFTDVGESPEEGLRVLDFRKAAPHLVVVLTTGKADHATVFRGAKEGAWDFFPKDAPIKGQVLPRLQIAFARVAAQRRLADLTSRLDHREAQLGAYRRALCTAGQLILSVALAIGTLAAITPYITSNTYRTAIFFGVLVISAMFFEFLKRIVFKVGSLEVSAVKERRSGNASR